MYEVTAKKWFSAEQLNFVASQTQSAKCNLQVSSVERMRLMQGAGLLVHGCFAGWECACYSWFIRSWFTQAFPGNARSTVMALRMWINQRLTYTSVHRFLCLSFPLPSGTSAINLNNIPIYILIHNTFNIEQIMGLHLSERERTRKANYVIYSRKVNKTVDYMRLHLKQPCNGMSCVLTSLQC